MTQLTRRRFMQTTAAGAAASALGGRAFAQDTAQIRHFWWGNPERDRRTFAVIDIFNEAHPNIQVTGETVGFGDYFPKLTTQIAGGNMPDVIQHGYGAIFEYIERGAILPLDEYVGNTIDLSGIDDSAIQAGTFDGQLYALSIGANAHMAMYNKAMYEAAGITAGDGFDPYGWTYDDVKRIAVAVSEATPDGVYGTDDNTANWQNFSDFVVQRGGQLYNEDDTIGATVEMLVEYWNIWKDIRDAGGAPPGPASAGLVSADMADWGIVTGQTATTYQWSNQLVGVQALLQDPVGAAMFPNTADMVPGSYVQPSQFICLTRDTSNAEAATTYMNAFVNMTEMTNVLGLERGIPANTEARNALIPTLTEAEAASVEYFDGIRGKTAELPPPFPSGANEVEETYKRVATGVLLEQSSMEDAAQDFIDQANFVLSRN
ncbi:ABC transporter substrate-binding protein [Pseudoroseicyclus tamaricis]|uniref:Extracellular solute-binding protein n=1 Tax=Pseudoroseicyclus tamaricis TaxID=2705421 RepID=A0A6B2JQ79_9RHOB|nr:extracellular solute-binding protein [Pseudoroseicyclus tamaricis]NDV00180.1 extracellular solute-binding protein [Pseudoroseicyclus tamaricis]